MAVLPKMGLEQPSIGADRGTWGTKINADLAKVDAHNHTAGQGDAVPTAGLNINADLSFNSLYGPTNLHAITFASIVALSSNTYNHSLFVSDGSGGLASGELYWRTSTGTHVKITAANALNVLPFTGGIGGDYTSVGAILAYDDAGKRYTHKEGTNDGNGWALLASGDVRLFETGSVDAVFVGLAAPAALASSYTLTWPLALPASTQLVQVNNAGSVTFTNTIVEPITASLGLTAAANQHITVSGTGQFKHGTRTRSIAGAAFVENSGATTIYDPGGELRATPTNAHASIGLDVGKRILAIRVFIKDSATGPTKLTAALFTASSSGVDTSIASVQSAGSGADQTLALNGLTTTISAGTGYSISVTTTLGGAQTTIYFAEIDYDNP
jgi:hypothetical protein